MGKKRRTKKKAPEKREEKEGIVIRSTGTSSIRVRTNENEQYDCVVRGKFRIAGLKSTNPVAVGDKVKFLLPADQSELGVVIKVLPRHNYILRKAIAKTQQVHILCANIDQAILLFTLEQPQTSLGFANRFLITAEAYHITPIIIFNKIDLYASNKQKTAFKNISDLYEKIGYQTVHLSALDEHYKPKIDELLADKVSFIGGHSGAGKSTLINLIDPNLNIKTATVSDYSQKGKHTTTYAEMHLLPNGGYIIDSPGIRELGLVSFEKNDLSHYFPEMRERLVNCKFNDCLHANEPNCAVKDALQTGEIHKSRYESYIKMLTEVE